MDKQYEETFPRKEFAVIHAELVARVESIQLSIANRAGEQEAETRAANTAKWIIGLIAAGVTALLVNLVHYWLAAAGAVGGAAPVK